MNDGENQVALWQQRLPKACQSGKEWNKRMEPKGIKDYIDKAKCLSTKKKKMKISGITEEFCIIWILKVLNNEDLWEKSQEFAQELFTYTQGAQQAKKTS